MIDQAIVIYYICDEICNSQSIKDDPQCKMTTAEVMTFAVLSASWCFGEYRRTRLIVKHYKIFSNLLSLSQLVRRIHRVPEEIWIMVFISLRMFLRNNKTNCFIVDSFPVKAYQNHKSYRARIFADKIYHGYTASKKQYFFGIKVHMIVDTDGIPIEFSFTAGSVSDIRAFRNMHLNLPSEAIIFADRAYNDYKFEDELLKVEGFKLLSKRKKNSSRQHSPSQEFILNKHRNRIETVFSSITSRMARNIRASTEKGFCLKVCFSIMAYMLDLYQPLN